MSDEAKQNDSVKVPVAVSTAQITSPTGKPLGELKQSIEYQSDTRLPQTAAGNRARVWAFAGGTAFVLMSALGIIGFFVKTASDSMEAMRQIAEKQAASSMAQLDAMRKVTENQVSALTTQLNDARKEAREDRQEMMGRYLESRGTADKRHADILVKLDKVVLWIESVFTTLWRERAGGKGSEALMPKISK